MPLDSARFDRQIEIWRDVKTGVNAYNEPVVTPTKLDTLWAARDFFGWRERQGAGQFSAAESTKFTVRYSEFAASITVEDTIKYNGRSYNIRAAQESRDGDYKEAIDIFTEGVVV